MQPFIWNAYIFIVFKSQFFERVVWVSHRRVDNGKFVLMHVMETYAGTRVTAPLILKLCTGKRRVYRNINLRN